MSEEQAAKKKHQQLNIQGKSYHPFKDFHLIRSTARALVFSIPAGFLRRFATSLNEFDLHSDLATLCQKSLHCFLFVVSKLDDSKFGYDGDQRALYVLEVVPSQAAETIAAGYRLWVFVHDLEWQPGDEYTSLVAVNKTREHEKYTSYNKKVQKVDENARHFRFHNLTSKDDLLHMFSADIIGFGANLAEENDCRILPLSNRDNLANPYYVYSFVNAMYAIPNAHPAYTKRKNYFTIKENIRSFKFPNPDRCYRLTSEQMKPQHLLNYYLPSIQTSVVKTSFDYKWYKQRCRVTTTNMRDVHDMEDDDQESLEDDEENEIKIPPEHIAVDDAFEFVVTAHQGINLQLTSDVLADRNRKAKAAIRKKANQMLRETKDVRKVRLFLSAERVKFEEQAMTDFQTLWHPEGNLSEEQLRLVRWGEQWLQDHDNFNGCLPKFSDNLPVAAEWTVRLMYHGEMVWLVCTAHEVLPIIIMSQLDAYGYRRDTKVHYLGSGPAGASKSFLLELGKLFFIPGTVETYNWRSPKSDTAVANMDGAILQTHEFSEILLGVRPKGTSVGQSPEQTTAFKDRLTRGEMRNVVMHINKETGKREKQTWDVKCNNTFQGNSNAPKNLMDAATADRFIIVQFEDVRREDKHLYDLLTVRPNDYMNELKSKLISDYRREQYLYCLIGMLQETEILPKVDMTEASMIINKVLRRAEFLGLPKQQTANGDKQSPRTFIRLKSLAEILAILKAIYIIFHSPCSPIRNKKWEHKDIFRVAPYLRATAQEAVLAMGLLKNHELEQRQYAEVLKTIVQMYFTPSSKANEKATNAAVTSHVSPSSVFEDSSSASSASSSASSSSSSNSTVAAMDTSDDNGPILGKDTSSNKNDGKEDKEGKEGKEGKEAKSTIQSSKARNEKARKDALRRTLTQYHLRIDAQENALTASEYHQAVKNNNLQSYAVNPAFVANYDLFANKRIRKTKATSSDSKGTDKAAKDGKASKSSKAKESKADRATDEKKADEKQTSSVVFDADEEDELDERMLAEIEKQEHEQEALEQDEAFMHEQQQRPFKQQRTHGPGESPSGSSASTTNHATNHANNNAGGANHPNNNNNNSGRAPTTTYRSRPMSVREKLLKLAQVIRPKMASRPSIPDLVSTLEDMTRMMTRQEDDQAEDISILDFTDDGFVIATEAIVNLTDDIIATAIKDVLCHKHARKQRLAFAVRRGGNAAPYILECIDIEPDEDNTMTIDHPLYADEKQRKMMQLMSIDSDGNHTIDLDRIYTNAAFSNADEDPELAYFQHHMANIWYSDEDVKKFNVLNSYDMDEQIKQASLKLTQLDQLLKYPEEAYMKSAERKAAQEVDKKKHPNKYSRRAERKEAYGDLSTSSSSSFSSSSSSSSSSTVPSNAQSNPKPNGNGKPGNQNQTNSKKRKDPPSPSS